MEIVVYKINQGFGDDIGGLILYGCLPVCADSAKLGRVQQFPLHQTTAFFHRRRRALRRILSAANSCPPYTAPVTSCDEDELSDIYVRVPHHRSQCLQELAHQSWLNSRNAVRVLLALRRAQRMTCSRRGS